MGVILLVRHGQASFGAADYDLLSEQGERQARRLAESWIARGIHPDRVVTGGLKRQRQTAAILAETLELTEPVTDERWNEYEHTAVMEHLTGGYDNEAVMVAGIRASPDPARQFQAILDEALAQWITAGPKGGDGAAGGPFAVYRARLDAALAALAEFPGTTAVVSSAGSISAAALPLLDAEPASWLRLQRVMVNTSVTKVVSGRSGLTLVAFNAHDHLEGAPGVAATYR